MEHEQAVMVARDQAKAYYRIFSIEMKIYSCKVTLGTEKPMFWLWLPHSIMQDWRVGQDCELSVRVLPDEEGEA